jgi:hypothetical protein
MGTEIVRSCSGLPTLVAAIALPRPRGATRAFVTSLKVA